MAAWSCCRFCSGGARSSEAIVNSSCTHGGSPARITHPWAGLTQCSMSKPIGMKGLGSTSKLAMACTDVVSGKSSSMYLTEVEIWGWLVVTVTGEGGGFLGSSGGKFEGSVPSCEEIGNEEDCWWFYCTALESKVLGVWKSISWPPSVVLMMPTLSAKAKVSRGQQFVWGWPKGILGLQATCACYCIRRALGFHSLIFILGCRFLQNLCTWPKSRQQAQRIPDDQQNLRLWPKSKQR